MREAGDEKSPNVRWVKRITMKLFELQCETYKKEKFKNKILKNN